MHPFYDYLSGKIADKLKKRRVLVVYDAKKQFSTYFLRELAAAEGKPNDLPTVQVKDVEAKFVAYYGSFFAVREQVEPSFSSVNPPFLLIYIPGEKHNSKASPLMELEKAGDAWSLHLRDVARRALIDAGFDDGQIDALWQTPDLQYDDIVSFFQQQADAAAPSVLRTLFGNAHGTELIVKWLTNPEKDADVEARNVMLELYQLIEARLGLRIVPETSLAEARRQCIRYVLVNEFRMEGTGYEPDAMAIVSAARNRDHRERIRGIAAEMRERHADTYMGLADEVETELGVTPTETDPSSLGAVDTFRFEERALLRYAAELAVHGKYEDVLAIVHARKDSVWIIYDHRRQQQWEVLRHIAELGQHITRVRRALSRPSSDPVEWICRYTADETGWFLMDMLHRRLDGWVSLMEQEPEAPEALAAIRRAYDEVVHRMAEGFSKSLRNARWSLPDTLHQTRVFPDVVQPMGGRVAYFLVDALRFEMGVELKDKLQEAIDLTLRPAVAALPTVTPVGMAALLPDASSTFTLVEHRGLLAAKIEGTILSGAAERKRHLTARMPDALDLVLEDVLDVPDARLRNRLKDKSFVVVRSQEIDTLGESSAGAAQGFMQRIIGNVARAVTKLARLGVDSFVVTSDHGYITGQPKDESMKIGVPGGQSVEMRRRCWVGRGGATPAGSVRVSGTELGYDTDLDFVFPLGMGVFKGSGSLRYHHGGVSLQEVVIPVLSFRMGQEKSPSRGSPISLEDVPEKIVNRTVSVRLRLKRTLFDEGPTPVRVSLVAGDEHVGETGMAIGASFDRSTGIVALPPGVDVDLGLLLSRDDCTSVRILVQEPDSGAILLQSNDIPVKLGLER